MNGTDDRGLLIMNDKRDGEPRTALLLGPHLDDVAFSAGGTVAMLAAAGWHCVLATLFTRSMPNPAGFALECQTSKELDPSIDYMKLRRGEDGAAAVALGCRTVHWGDRPEAPHRGYESAAELFGSVHPDDIWQGVADDVRRLVAMYRPSLVMAPQSYGGHVDHVLVSTAVADLPGNLNTAWYFDTPYAIRPAVTAPPSHLADRLADRERLRVPLPNWARNAKLDACAAYGSQLGFQFGGEAGMRETLGAITAEEFVTTGDAAAPLRALCSTDREQ